MGDDDDKNKGHGSDTSSTWDFGGEEETQIFDSPNSSFGNKLNDDANDQLHTIQSTIPFDDTIMCEEDELATQLMDPDCETQLFNLAGETQVVNFDAEIKEMDMADIENNETQFFNGCYNEEVVSDHEGTDKTEVLGVSDELSEDDSANHRCKKDNEYKSKTECGTSKQHTSGSGSKTFTSTRAASLRASGLAALNKASHQSKSPSYPASTSELENEHQRILAEKHDNLIDQPETGNRSGFDRSTARKLFADDALDEENDYIALGGLSYIDSQEPGDLSQANALDFVDTFLKVNIECGEERDINKSTGGKSKSVLTAKGAQTFAKSASLINAVDKRAIFYYDGNCEDDGGGEFFIRKKEAFYGSGSHRRVKSSISSGKGLVCSDSKVVLGDNKINDKPKKSLGTHIKDLTSRKNLIQKLDKHSTNIPVPDGMDIQETTDARFDTQMAAEAMEDLCTIQNLAPPSNDGVRPTQSKLKSMLITDKSKEVKKWTKSTAKKKVVGNENKKLDDVSSDVAKRKGTLPLKRPVFVASDAPSASLVDQTSVKKRCIQHVTPIAQNVTPVARRARKSVVSESKKVIDASSDLAEKISIPTGFHPKGKRSSQKLSSLRLTRSTAARLTEQEKGSLKERDEPTSSACKTPVNRTTHVKESSPICMGDEYLKQSWRKSRIRASLIQEFRSLSPVGTSIISPNKDTRERRDISLIRVVFSRHLDGDIIKQQKKILSRLGASESSSMSDATHFIADDFVRTRNILEAIALGKPVVTHLWLQSCGHACCHIDEKNFILRDAKKEKEFGFSLPTSLSRARQNPLLKGQKVLITPNTKPGKEILFSLVKAVHGVAVERMGRTAVKDDKAPAGLLILSCEEDYALCLPFLEKGAAIYSSELLLNGIVTQRLEYERHRLFVDHVKRTRSTFWLKKDDNKFKAVGKVK